MPIGKNSIKRVANAGYSKVKTEAPDMENSVVNEAPKKAAPKKKAATEKTAPVSKKSPSQKKTSTAKKAPVNNATPLVTAEKFAVGDELPTYLL